MIDGDVAQSVTGKNQTLGAAPAAGKIEIGLGPAPAGGGRQAALAIAESIAADGSARRRPAQVQTGAPAQLFGFRFGDIAFGQPAGSVERGDGGDEVINVGKADPLREVPQMRVVGRERWRGQQAKQAEGKHCEALSQLGKGACRHHVEIRSHNHAVPDMKPIIARAEVALDYPDKTYMGVFERESRYAAESSPEAFTIKFEHHGEERKIVDIHIAHTLFAQIVEDLAEHVRHQKPIDPEHRKTIDQALRRLSKALTQNGRHGAGA